MRFLSVAERELRAAARRPGLHRLRWLTATAFFILLLWMAWAFDLFTRPGTGPQVFQGFSVMIFLYCLLVGATGTADCISRERREGTLGLLFLTNLNSAEIVAGKLCSSILSAAYPLLAIFPLLALPILVGGITAGQVGRTLVALLNTIFFAVTAGLIASAVSVRQFPAITLATSLALIFGMGPEAAAEALRSFGYPKSLAGYLAACCPLHALTTAQSRPRAAVSGHYWLSLVAVAGMSWVWLALIAWRLRRSWQDRHKSAPFWVRFGWGQRWRGRGRDAHTALRRRLLDINPLFWLASRGRIGSPIFMLVAVVVAVLAVWVASPMLDRSIGGGAISPLAGLFVAWLFGTLTLHALTLYHGATVASQNLAEDRKTGALELILSTPTSERTISRGLWRAFGRRMFFPALVVVLAHLFLIWLGAVVIIFDPPQHLPPGTTPAQLIWHALWGHPLAGFRMDWAFAFMLRIFLGVLGVLMAAWLTLGWLGRWLGLSLKHPGFAPLISVAAILVPPILLFALVCYLFDKWGLDRMPERRYLPLMLGVACAISLGNCLALSVWAAGRLRQDLRAIATGSLEPRRFWWLPRRRTVFRLGITAGTLALVLVLAIIGFTVNENWRSRRDWEAFQQELQQHGESLDLAAILPGPVRDEDNFARSPSFLQLVQGTGRNASRDRLWTAAARESHAGSYAGQAAPLLAWTRRQSTDFTTNLSWLLPKSVAGTSTNRQLAAAAVCEGLKPLEADLRAIAEVSQRTGFQLTTNRQHAVVFDSNSKPLAALHELEFLFRLRASARLATGQADAAGDDLLNCLRMAGFARQSPDAQSTLRTQALLCDSFQPLWEGIVLHRWNEAQLAAFQAGLERFPLLADYTNAVHRVVLAHVESWRAFPDAAQPVRSVPVPGGYIEREEWVWQPSGWWFDHCRQLYRAGQNAVTNVDVSAGRVSQAYNWSDLQGLPLDYQISTLLQPQWWSPTPAILSFAQCSLNQAILACALERYRLAHGDYPETLVQLVPDFLDRVLPDVPHGRPMHYKRESSDRFILRGFGTNGANDQDKTASDDWLWAFPVLPTNAPSAILPRRK